MIKNYKKKTFNWIYNPWLPKNLITILLQQIKTIIWNISREICHDPQLTRPVASPSSPSFFISFLFHSALSLIQYSALVSSITVVGVDLNLYLVLFVITT